MLTNNMPITATPRTTSSVRCRVCACPPRQALFLGGLGLKLDVVLQAHARDHLELGLERVDMLFLILEDFASRSRLT